MAAAGKSKTCRFSRRFYVRRALEAAAGAHAGLATLRVLQTKDHIIVRMTHIRFPDADRFVKEFANYALGMTKRCLASD